MFNEILLLEQFCKDNEIEVVRTELWGGYKLEFNNGADVIQHSYSYGNDEGCVEFAGLPEEDCNYAPIGLDLAKALVVMYKEELNSK